MELDIEVLRLDSTLSPRDEQTALARLSENRPCIAYVTPERLGEPRFRERLASVRVALFVVVACALFAMRVLLRIGAAVRVREPHADPFV